MKLEKGATAKVILDAAEAHPQTRIQPQTIPPQTGHAIHPGVFRIELQEVHERDCRKSAAGRQSYFLNSARHGEQAAIRKVGAGRPLPLPSKSFAN